MNPIVVFDIAGLAVMLGLFVYAVGTAVREHFSPSTPTRDSIDD